MKEKKYYSGSFLPVMAYLIFSLIFLSCNRSPDKNANSNSDKGDSMHKPPAEVSIEIIKIDGKEIPPDSYPEVSKNVTVELASSRDDIMVVVLVHPMSTDQWWVQNFPSYPNKGDNGKWYWKTVVFCGTENLGINDSYEIIALADSIPTVFTPGQQIKVADAITSFSNYPRSANITVQRIK